MKKKRVLLVEDDVTGALLMKESLSDIEAIEVEAVGSGEEALRQLEQRTWDLVVTDVRMPGITGLELIETLQRKAPGTIPILITAHGSEEVEQAARRLKVYRYMTKPFPLSDLKRVIQDALELESNPDNHSVSGTRTSSMRQAVKVTLGGEGSVGKTTLIRRLCTGAFEPRRNVTIGVEFHVYDVRIDQRANRLIVWDVSGQDHFAYTRRAFYRGSRAVALVYAVDNRPSFERLLRWREEIRELLPNIPILIVGNKTDLPRQISAAEGRALADAWGVPFFETNCVNGQGVHEFFGALADIAARNIRRSDSPARESRPC